MPIGTPSASEIDTDTTPARIEARAPQMMRDSTSRPSSSAPNQCAALGAARTALQLVASGSYGAIHGAKQREHHEEHDHREAEHRAAAAQQAPPRSSLWRDFQFLEDDRGHQTLSLRIDEEVGEVGQQVERDVDRGGEQHHALHHRDSRG